MVIITSCLLSVKVYGKNRPATVAASARALRADYLVVDRRHCEWKTGGGMDFTALIDTLGKDAEELFCKTVGFNAIFTLF